MNKKDKKYNIKDNQNNTTLWIIVITTALVLFALVDFSTYIK
tara:strand:- start:1897 stop:2022 length:126 start_codon:yes stop_codon:yes gene_type:complete